VRRTIFYVSDGTGITAETVGHAVLTQFPGMEFNTVRFPFIETPEQADHAAEQIAAAGRAEGVRPLVFSSVVNPVIREALMEADALLLDIFQPFVTELEAELGTPRSLTVGRAHGLGDPARYDARIAATNFALSHDDGMGGGYGDADVVLIGVSRSGKTPTCLYLALHYGVRAANDPLVPEDLEAGRLPDRLVDHRDRLFGLTIDPERLTEVRETRLPGTRYASLEQCRWEVAAAERLLEAQKLPVVSTTRSSVEEIASMILNRLKLRQPMF
jgi:[pyruvate, water dikinase]-phosphate phosphotransferase / [pyruvate, water dikinase] kinase